MIININQRSIVYLSYSNRIYTLIVSLFATSISLEASLSTLPNLSCDQPRLRMMVRRGIWYYKRFMMYLLLIGLCSLVGFVNI